MIMSLSGFGNYHQTEAVIGALPTKQHAPQKCPLELYAEQISGSPFTAKRQQTLASWLYRKLPSVSFQDYKPLSINWIHSIAKQQPPVPMRWSPFDTPEPNCDFIEGIYHIAGNATLNAYLYQCDASMTTRYLSNNDGEMLIVPYLGEIQLQTEFGQFTIRPGWIAVIPKGIKFKIRLKDSFAAGYICENKAAPLTLPELGPIGANGLAYPEHFLYPEAAFEDTEGEIELVCKYQDRLWSAQSDKSPLNVVAWRGNYAPYCYDLSLFNAINSVSFDHCDPSIFTVLTSPSNTPGVANLDFVIFPDRWMVAEHTFRPPYFHRNVMSELMGLIYGQYDAKEKGFQPGGLSIHNAMTAHGPDRETFVKASSCKLKPERYAHTLAFMFETQNPWQVTDWAYEHPCRQKDYLNCWKGF